jgi:hypothetical protein
MQVLDEHGNYGAVVRFTSSEWEAFETFMQGYDTEESQE